MIDVLVLGRPSVVWYPDAGAVRTLLSFAAEASPSTVDPAGPCTFRTGESRVHRVAEGHLNPGSPDVVFDRFGLDLDELVRHVWVVRWDLPQARFVANVLVPGPAGSPPDPVPVLGTPLASVAEAVAGPHGPDTDHLVAILTRWLEPFAAGVDDVGRLVNRACQLAEERSDLHRVEDLACEVGTTPRTVHRLVTRATGLSPKWLLECRRLQVAATTLYTTPEVDLAVLAAELGFVDQSHFTRRYGEVLGETPDEPRRAGRAARAAGGRLNEG